MKEAVTGASLNVNRILYEPDITGLNNKDNYFNMRVIDYIVRNSSIIIDTKQHAGDDGLLFIHMFYAYKQKGIIGLSIHTYKI